MSRYIDADALVKRLKHSPLFLGTNMQFKDGVINLVEKQPTADVAPIADTVRKMQERLKRAFNFGHTILEKSICDIIDQIAEEMLEGEKGETTNEN